MNKDINKAALKYYSDISFRLSDKKAKNDFLQNEQKKSILLILSVVFCILLINSTYEEHGNKYFPLEFSGHLKTFVPYSKPVGTFEERADFAKWLVQNMNSLSYVDKDVTLSKMEMYFDPMVYKQYIVKQYTVGYFKQMMRYSLVYNAEVYPGHSIDGKKTSLLLANNACYKSNPLSPECRYIKVGVNHSETHLFDLERTINLPKGKKQLQKYQVRITLTRTDVTKSPFPYLVSEYTEII